MESNGKGRSMSHRGTTTRLGTTRIVPQETEKVIATAIATSPENELILAQMRIDRTLRAKPKEMSETKKLFIVMVAMFILLWISKFMPTHTDGIEENNRAMQAYAKRDFIDFNKGKNVSLAKVSEVRRVEW